MSDLLLSADQLTCIREDRILFDQLSFEVTAGELIQVEGPNGAGKTSLLRILAGLSRPYDGRVNYKQQDITQVREEFYNDLTFIGHLAGVKSELSAEQNLAFNLQLQNDDTTGLEQALDQVNLTGFEHAPAAFLSAGQNRRIALARLWQSHSKIWILDEPFTAIDKTGVEKLERLFIHHIDNGGCVILTSHQDIQIGAQRLKRITLDYNFE
ncbi:cytochrome c biogenesis heme-transporting ATPase CcmA [Psychrobium sp. 1_MG-2023]|uniref:cytochrome c biogenesis heme-transporting ATPase CcmA n=1 Tax=Psychrobium sp. 1_MG-2023 TaxID=3062624 RepID=UPI000C33011C|nr:cytochrome c biogenesis heme-transporting ATPase CcmA [Psychrobium sp. 1_MG-2023]MDP2562635.1 cytochrome c biogenesis heme-transporting ATPase CcmA [Psychrobium sp. 1_MG-2023]PKF54390.1 heme ABC transporter ATP-binding protein CcmA [Alteromonadales bacterium alter-6D02]